MGETSLSQRIFSGLDPLVGGIIPESLTGPGGTPFLGSSLSPAVNLATGVRAALTGGTAAAVTQTVQGQTNPATAAIRSLFGQGSQVQQVNGGAVAGAACGHEPEDNVLMQVKVGRVSGRVRLASTQKGTCMLSSEDLKIAKKVMKTLKKGQRFLPDRMKKTKALKPAGTVVVRAK